MAMFKTYDDTTTRKEDVTDIIENIAPQETQLLTGLQKTTAANTLHEFLADTLTAAADNALIEGDDPAYAAVTAPTRENNITQIFTKDYNVSGTQQAVDHHGMRDPRTYQIQKKMKELATDMELAIMRGSRASGAASTARRMDGVIASITTNATALASGTTLTETILNNLIGLSWAQTDEVVNELYMGQWLKRKISSFFTTSSPKYTDASDRRIVNAVDFYESDFGVHKLFKHRYVQVSADSTGRIVGIQSNHWAVSYLQGRRPSSMPLAKTGDADKGMMVTELTLEDRAEKSSFVATGFNLIG